MNNFNLILSVLSCALSVGGFISAITGRPNKTTSDFQTSKWWIVLVTFTALAILTIFGVYQEIYNFNKLKIAKREVINVPSQHQSLTADQLYAKAYPPIDYQTLVSALVTLTADCRVTSSISDFPIRGGDIVSVRLFSVAADSGECPKSD